MNQEARGRRRRIAGVIAALRHRDLNADQAGASDESELEALKRRVDHLEAALEGLQDSVYRESRRLDDELSELHKQIAPGAMSQAIEADARRRGL
jgi:hypothetical protein